MSLIPIDMEDELPQFFSIESTNAENENDSVVRVFYATDRAAETISAGDLDYSGDRSPGGALN